MTRKTENRDLDQRVRALATVYLTRRSDLVVKEQARSDNGLDLLVGIQEPDHPTQRIFGVALKGVVIAVTEKEAARSIQPQIRELHHRGPYPYPVCVFLFTMENNEGYYAWAFEPVIGQDGKVAIKPDESPKALKLNANSLAEIVKRVNAWYDGLFKNLGL